MEAYKLIKCGIRGGIRRTAAAALALFMCASIYAPHLAQNIEAAAAQTQTASADSAEAAEAQAGAQHTTIKVGYVELPGLLSKNDKGAYSGIAYDILNEVAVYNNWQYEYIESSYGTSVDMLNSGEIDVFLPYQKTEERQQSADFTQNPLCTNVASLVALPDAEIYYDDFAHMDGITVGVEIGTRNGERYEQYLAAHGANITLKQEYNGQSEMTAALENGDIDAFITASNRGIANCKIICTLPQQYSYFMVKKGNTALADELDDALERIQESMPGLASELDVRYRFPEAGAYPSLTREEAQYVKEQPTLTVLLSSQECDKDGNFTGSAKALFERITELTGLKFMPLIKDSITDIYDGFTNGEADLMYSFDHDYAWGEAHNAYLTQSYAEFDNKIVQKPATTQINTVAAVPGTYIHYYLENNTDYKIVNCSSYRDGIEMVYNGVADATYCNSPIGNYYSTFPKYSSLSFMSAYNFKGAYCIAVSEKDGSQIVDILNKAVICIPQSYLTSMFEQQAAARPLSMTDYVYSQPLAAALIVTAAAVLLAILIMLLIFNITSRKKNAELTAANNAKTEFLSRMSHDMRTPMNGILGLTYLMKDETDPEKIKEGLAQIELSGGYLLNLINDTLDMNKIESGALELKPKKANGAQLFSNVLSHAKMLADERDVNLVCDLPKIAPEDWLSVYADATRLEQVFVNIISNAVKFTPPGGTVTLKLRNISQDNGVVVDEYTITDNGIGMSEEFLPHIFEPFAQEGRLHTAREQGTGLGMPIVKQLVALMGGTIDIKSQINKGTEVKIVMPFKIAGGEADAEHKSDADLSQLCGKRVLVCEDHPLNRQIATRLLEKQGIESEVAENGETGVRMFESSDIGYYDAIIMDIRMPVMNGLEASRAIRALERSDAKTIPIIAMTANAFDSDVQNCFDSGMNAHIAKPIDTQILYETLASFIANSASGNTQAS